MFILKRFLSIAAGLLLAVVSVQAQDTANINIIHHNIKSGGRGQAAADHIVDLMNLTPDKAVILVNEANYARQYFDLPHAGWNHIWKANPHEGRGNAIFTRDEAASMTNSWVLSMTEPWEHKQPKDPRVYPVAKVELVNKPWVKFHIVNVHFPTNRASNEAARQESIDRLIQVHQNQSDLPLIICGDFNMGKSAARQNIANPIGGKIYSDASVDHIIVRDGPNVGFQGDIDVTRMGQMGSDHQALRYRMTFVELNSSVSDWSLY